jgi:hypothetical protein
VRVMRDLRKKRDGPSVARLDKANVKQLPLMVFGDFVA